jgi:hypothetical protein
VIICRLEVRHRTTRPVELVCPRCGLDRTGQVVVPTRWACAFGVPVARLGQEESLVVCDECGHTSDLGALDVPTTAQLATLLRDATVAALVLAVRSTDREAFDAVYEAALVELTDAGFGDARATFRNELDELSPAEARLRLRRIGHELTSYGKQGFLHRVTSALADSEPLDQTQRDALVGIGCDLGMAAPHINGVLAVATLAA